MCHFHFFELSWPWDLKELCRQFSVGFFLQKIVFWIFHLPSKGCSYNLQKDWYISVLHAVAFGVLEDKRQRSHIFRCIDQSFLCPQQTKNIGIFVSLCSESTVTERLLVVKTWMCTERQTTDSLLWSARKSSLLTVAVIFWIGMVRIELLANCRGRNLVLKSNDRLPMVNTVPSLHQIAVTVYILILSNVSVMKLVIQLGVKRKYIGFINKFLMYNDRLWRTKYLCL